MDRKSMVRIDTLNESCKNAGYRIEEEINLYESGMISVLREVANSKVGYEVLVFTETEEIKKAENKTTEIISRLIKRKDTEKLGFDIEEAYNYLRYLEEKEAFITGFIEGYKFLKQLSPNKPKEQTQDIEDNNEQREAV